MLTNDAEALARGMALFGGRHCPNDIASGLENKIDRVCMYCQQKYGEKEGGTGVTHGICPACMREKGLDNVAPPGMEDVVRELKKDPAVDNPFAVAWAIHEERKNDIASGLENTGGCICGHGFNHHITNGCISCNCNSYRSAQGQEIEERMVGMHNEDDPQSVATVRG